MAAPGPCAGPCAGPGDGPCGDAVIRLTWNALRVGQHVLVHDEDDPLMALVPGRVTDVEQAPGSNDVTIRLSPSGRPAKVVRPRRLMVHLDAGDLDDDDEAERCWRCEANLTSTRPDREHGTPPKDRSR